MGCHPSIPRRPASPATDDERPPKPFDSRLESCQSLSSPCSSISLISPILSIIPPSPPPSPPPQKLVETISETELGLSVAEIDAQIQALLPALSEYEALITESREKILSELHTLLEVVSDATLVHTKLEILTSHISKFCQDQHTISTYRLQPIRASFPSLWSEFLSFSFEEKRHHARTQKLSSPVVKICNALADVRRCIEVQRELDEKVARRIRGSFEEVLGELKVAGPQEAALKWRVLGIVVGKRREKLEEVVLEILRVRMGVSKGLVDLVDVLGESE